VHEKGSFIYAQLWALGRVADAKILERDGNYPYVSSYPMQLKGHDEVPRALTLPEIKEYVQDYAVAAKNAIAAGFDGVEIHGANGNLVDQFLQNVVNKRTDEYGGSVENRSRFGLEVVEAVVAAVGQDRTAIRLSPWNTKQGFSRAIPLVILTCLTEDVNMFRYGYGGSYSAIHPFHYIATRCIPRVRLYPSRRAVPQHHSIE
jgi:NADPH2 dehydrogenase